MLVVMDKQPRFVWGEWREERKSVNILVRDLVLPEQLNTLRLENLLPRRGTRTLVQDSRKQLDVLLRLGEQARAAGLEELVLLLWGVLLELVGVEVLTDAHLA